MAILGQKLGQISGAATLCMAMMACGGGGSDSVAVAPPVVVAPPDDPIIQETIEGVATPSSVSVVTATNAT